MQLIVKLERMGTTGSSFAVGLTGNVVNTVYYKMVVTNRAPRLGERVMSLVSLQEHRILARMGSHVFASAPPAVGRSVERAPPPGHGRQPRLHSRFQCCNYPPSRSSHQGSRSRSSGVGGG